MISRFVMITIIGGAVVGLLTGLEETFSNIPQNVIFLFEIWRLVTYPVMDSNFLTLLFTMMSFYRQGPALEMRIGSAALAATIL
jgi:membrane associated rhomboid family serine protease